MNLYEWEKRSKEHWRAEAHGDPNAPDQREEVENVSESECKHEWVQILLFTGTMTYCKKCDKEKK